MWCHWLRLCALPVYFTKKFWETDETEVVFGRSDKKVPHHPGPLAGSTILKSRIRSWPFFHLFGQKNPHLSVCPFDSRNLAGKPKSRVPHLFDCCTGILR